MSPTRAAVKLIAGVLLLLFAPLPQNGFRPLVVPILQWVGGANNPQVDQAVEVVGGVIERVNEANTFLLGGAGPYPPVFATGVIVLNLLTFVLYWFSRSHVGPHAAPTERLLRTAGPALLALLMLASPVVAFTLCVLHLLFTTVTPSREAFLRAIVHRLTGL